MHIVIHVYLGRHRRLKSDTGMLHYLHYMQAQLYYNMHMHVMLDLFLQNVL